MLRIGAAILCGLFLLPMAVQLDDPDALRWVAIYGLAALLAGMGAAGRFPLGPNLARVGRALAGLPALERALLANVLPWSKVRLLARVATPEDEEEWIARAPAQPTRRLEQAVLRS
jgi:hypothetical protein